MSERDPRKMASQIAGVRASETHLPEDERVFFDPYAEYFSASVIEGTSPLKEAQVLRQFVASEGAPLQFGIKEGKIEGFFKERGFDAVTNVTTASCKEKYFKNASCYRDVSPMFNFVHATVPSKE